jgi:hypothetical protein
VTGLSEKYRPTRFDEVRGQKLAVEWCRNQIRTNKGQSILFSGPIRVGKTSVALIYAKARFCESPTEDMSPCHACASCNEFGERGQNLPDFTRHDCGERSRIEDIINLADLARQAPFYTDYRVFFLDEVHNLSPRGFDALLKALETHHRWGPTIILATTKLDKVPRTIRSRVKEPRTRSPYPKQTTACFRSCPTQIRAASLGSGTPAGPRAWRRWRRGTPRNATSNCATHPKGFDSRTSLPSAPAVFPHPAFMNGLSQSVETVSVRRGQPA